MYLDGVIRKEGIPLGKEILVQYADKLARVQLLRQQQEKRERQLDRIRKGSYLVGDTVSCGKRGKKPLGTVRITGYPYSAAQRMEKACKRSLDRLMEEEQELLEEMVQAEEYIAGIENTEIRNILTLYYVENMNWIQVASRMNVIYRGLGKTYTESSCRQKHDRFLKKF